MRRRKRERREDREVRHWWRREGLQAIGVVDGAEEDGAMVALAEDEGEGEDGEEGFDTLNWTLRTDA